MSAGMHLRPLRSAGRHMQTCARNDESTAPVIPARCYDVLCRAYEPKLVALLQNRRHSTLE